MTLRTKFDRLENQMHNPDNPLLAGTHEHHIQIRLGGHATHTGPGEWVECIATGERFPVNDQWRKYIREYDDTVHGGKPPITFTITTTPTTDDGAPTTNGVQ